MGFAVSGMLCFIWFARPVLPNDAYWPILFAALFSCRMGVIEPGTNRDRLQRKTKRTGQQSKRVASNGSHSIELSAQARTNQL